MSCVIPRCDRCHLDRVFVRVAPFPNQENYGVEWRCPHCDDHLLDVCPLGPVVPTADACLNCGAPLPTAGDFAKCANCALTRLGARDLYGVDPLPADPVAIAGKLFDAGLVRRAVATINQALIENPGSAEAWRVKYSFLSGLGFFRATLDVIDAASEHVADPDLLIAKAHALAGLQNYREAIGVYQEYLAENATGEYAAAALHNMGDSARTLGDVAAAETFYRQAIERDPNCAAHYPNYIRLLLDQKRFDEAHPLIDRGWVCAKEPEIVRRLLEDKALAFAEQNRGVESLQCIDAAIERGADGIRAHYLRGRALALLGRLSEAKDCMRRVLKNDPKNAGALRAIRLIDEATP